MNGATGPGLPPWIIIVHRDEDRLFRQLSQAFESDPRVTVIKDRRRAARRSRMAPVTAERRKTERRAPPAVKDEILWRSLRFRLIHRDQEIKVYQAPEPPPAPTAQPAKKTPTRRQTSARPRAGKRRSARPTRSPRRRRGRR